MRERGLEQPLCVYINKPGFRQKRLPFLIMAQHYWLLILLSQLTLMGVEDDKAIESFEETRRNLASNSSGDKIIVNTIFTNLIDVHLLKTSSFLDPIPQICSQVFYQT